MSVLGVRREGPLSAAFPCSLRGDSSESAEERVSEGGREQEGGDKTAACSHPTFYSGANPFV